MKQPLIFLAFVFCLGIISAEVIRINFLIIYPLGLIFLILSFLSLKKRLSFDILLSCLIFLLGFAFFVNHKALPRCHISRYVYYKSSEPYLIRGFVNSPPIIKNKRVSFIFRARQIQSGNLNYHCCGDILVNLKGNQGLSYGDELILKGDLRRPFRASGKIYPLLHVKTQNAVIRLDKNKGLALKRLAFWLKDKTEGILSTHTSNLGAGILDAMILGEKRNVPAFVYNSMMKSGTVHILVVSGFNVGIVAFILLLFLKLIRLPKKIRMLIAIPFLVLYCFVTGASTPVLRATIMAIFFLIGALARREADIYNSCGLAAVFILVISPQQLFDIGFQLSFASVLSIVYLYPKLKSLLHIETYKIQCLKFLLEGCLVSLSAWLGTAGFIAYYFKSFSPITVLANVFTVPLATFITLCGFSLILASLLAPACAPAFAYTIELAVMLLVKMNNLFIALPGACFRLS